MKVKDGFLLRQVAGAWMAVPVGERLAQVRGLISLNETGASIWRLLEQGGRAAEALREGERLLRAAGVGVRDVGAGARNDAAAQPLGRGARRRQTAELLRAGGHECMPGHQFAQNAVRKALGRAVIPAGDAEQAGTDENSHRAPRFPRLHVKPKIMPSTPPAMCVSWARPAVPVTA